MREARGMTIERLAEVAGMHPTYLSQIELLGRNLTWEKLSGLASGLGTTIVGLTAHAEAEARHTAHPAPQQS
jgi:transcriptional regulator with XRE-family HTH domain